jgi:hypothetical protein
MRWLITRWQIKRLRSDDGMVTAEYALVTVAACAFAVVLYKVVTGDGIAATIGRIIRTALESSF